MTDSRTHVHYFDYIRLIAAFSVIYMHVASGPLRMGMDLNWELTNICVSIGFTAVPLFLMLSGYLLLSSPKTTSVEILIKKRLPRLVLPLIFWTAVAITWTLFSEHSLTPRAFISHAVDALNEPAAVHLWYMYTLIAIYVISPFIYGAVHSLDRSGHIYLLVLIGLVSLQSIFQAVLPINLMRLTYIDLLNKLQIFGGYLCIFILGYYLGSTEKVIPNKILIPLTVAIIAIIAFGTHRLTFLNGEYTSNFQRQCAGFEVVLAACIFLIFKQNFNRPSKLLKAFPVVPLLFSVYLMHCTLLSIFYAFGISPVSFIDTLWVTLLDFVICWICLKTVASIKPLCYLVTGIKYDDACRSCNWIYTFKKKNKT